MKINCDIGEGMENDDQIMPFIDAANIACGAHAGDEETMRRTILMAMDNKVEVGAHISYYDRENFGRSEMQLTACELEELVSEQLELFKRICDDCGTRMAHVKPHGALYNMSARDPFIAAMIAAVVKGFDQHLVLYGLSGSHSIIEGKKAGLAVANEVFADRTYQDDGSLTTRVASNALITDPSVAVAHVTRMIETGHIKTVSGKLIPIAADSICVHGDGTTVIDLLQSIRSRFPKKSTVQN